MQRIGELKVNGARLRVLAGFIAVLISVLWASSPAQAEDTKQNCAPSEQFHYVCGLANPEDLVSLGSSPWLVASGDQRHGGLAFIDTRNETALVPSGALTVARDPKLPTCPITPPTAKSLFAHGLFARASGKDHYRLYVVGHEPEAIHVFDIDTGSDTPTLSWAGCVSLPPKLEGNSVAALPDGTILATVLMLPGTTMADMVLGKDTGTILRWRPGEAGFSELSNTRMPGNNGIEVSDDGKVMYVVASGIRSVVAFTLSDRPRKLWSVETPVMKPDNIHREPSGAYLAAGMVHDEKACGGPRKIVNGQLEMSDCHRGSVAARLDPHTRQFKLVAQFGPDPMINNVASAAIAGGRVWFGSFNGDRIASAPIPER